MKIRHWIALGLAGALLVTAGTWLAPDRHGIRLSGRLLAVGYAPGCASDQERLVNLWAYFRGKLETLRLWPKLPAGADCRVTAVRWAPNAIPNAGENFLVNMFLQTNRGHRTLVGGGAGGGTTYPSLLADFRYHACGSEDTAVAEAHVGLVSECTTQTNADNVRQFGTQVVGATSNIYRTVATITFDATDVITEWGLFHTSAVNTGHMWSRVLVSPGIGVNSGDSVTFTYDLTIE